LGTFRIKAGGVKNGKLRETKIRGSWSTFELHRREKRERIPEGGVGLESTIFGGKENQCVEWGGRIVVPKRKKKKKKVKREN